jgi:primosomal protein N' (replication factor Y) (superfamily II helicase)
VPGQVIVQTYWPDHPAILAAAAHDPALFFDAEKEERSSAGLPPYGRLANVLLWGRERQAVAQAADQLARQIGPLAPAAWEILGPSPCPLSRLKGVWRWHLLVRTAADDDLSRPLATALRSYKALPGVSVAVDVDPVDLL